MESGCRDGSSGSLDEDSPESDEISGVKPILLTTGLRPRRRSATTVAREHKETLKKVRLLIAKEDAISQEDQLFLLQHQDIVSHVKARSRSYSDMKERKKEVLDNDDTLDTKCRQLSGLLQSSTHCVVYTGAGISTAADIPDYRGTNGVWTKMKAGQTVSVERSIVLAEPTTSHMCINALVESNIVQYVLSQNCDGLHIRSGLPPQHLAEIHGNMFTEICPSCEKRYYRVFDVTELTGLRKHKTGRTCDKCNTELSDTIVHFGEKSHPSWPHNWQDAEDHADETDLILCLGTSLKVLRSYKQLWGLDRPKNSRPKLVIVNLQWTPKDKQAFLKINGYVDDVLTRVMQNLDLTAKTYHEQSDALISLATPVKLSEVTTFHTCCIPLSPQQAVTFPESSLRHSDVTSDDVIKGDEVFSSETATTVTPSWFGKGCRKSSGSSSSCKKRRRKSTPST